MPGKAKSKSKAKPKPPKDWGKWFKRTRPAATDKDGWQKWIAAVAKHNASK